MADGLYSWQEPFRRYLGRTVKIIMKRGRNVYGIPFIPGMGSRHASGNANHIGRGLWIHTSTGNVMKISIGNIENMEIEWGQSGNPAVLVCAYCGWELNRNRKEPHVFEKITLQNSHNSSLVVFIHEHCKKKFLKHTAGLWNSQIVSKEVSSGVF